VGAHLAELQGMVERGDLSSTAAKEVLSGVFDGEGSPREVAAARDLIQISDSGSLEAAVESVLAAHSGEVERLRSGEQRLIGFLVGLVMKETGGRADPRVVSSLIRDRTGG
jgi:aspartyl-tRNA(Asn)/glutamyl-tRNA(Gln) amidotransferase subunit B